MAEYKHPFELGISRGNGQSLPLLLSENLLLNNRAIALLSDRSPDEIEFADAGVDGGFVYEKSKARLSFFNGSSPLLVANVLTHWPASKRVGELEVAECPDQDLLVKLFGQRYKVSTMQILSFETSPEMSAVPISARVGASSPELIELVRGFHREALHSSIPVHRARELLNSSSRNFFESRVNGQSVAIAALTRKVGRARCLSFFYVAPSYRGQSIGKAIFAHALAQGLARYDKIFLHVDSSNLPAVRLYAGFASVCLGEYRTVSAVCPIKDTQ